MEAPVKSMAQKRARHYNETKSVVAVSLIIFGISFAFSLIVLWPQSSLVSVFNSRLLYKMIVDNEDYYTCDKEYVDFVVDEPTEATAMISFYVFNVSNAYEVIERGDQPVVTETGPFAFTKQTYRYDIYFDAQDSSTVTYKEYSFLTPVEDADSCEAMYYRLERDYAAADPCANSRCKCKSFKEYVTVVNPLFLKILWEDSPFELLAYYSAEVFQAQMKYLDEPFTEAVKAHLVSEALKEVYQFRLQMRVMKIVDTAFATLSENYTLENITTWLTTPVSQCGLSIYRISVCPFAPMNFYEQLRNASLPSENYPPLHLFFNASHRYSLMNTTYGQSRWIGLAWYYGQADFNGEAGYTMASRQDLSNVLEEFIQEVGYDAFQTTALTPSQRQGIEIAVRSVTTFFVRSFLSPYRFSSNTIEAVYTEFNATSSPVICAPLGQTCLYQYGYLQSLAEENALFALNSDLIRALIDVSSEVSTEGNNFYKDLNAPRWYNVYTYYHHILQDQGDEYPALNCTNYGATIRDATYVQPAYLWGSARGINIVNITLLFGMYDKTTESEKQVYRHLATNLSVLLFDVYREATTFHDDYTIRFINKNKDSALEHNFTTEAFSELGLAQWAGGYITDALARVRTTKQLVRDGMWLFGEEKYHNYYLEYASYAIMQGFPHALLTSVDDARTLLSALARADETGVAFRRHLLYTGATYIGDGEHPVNDVGDVGDVTFTREANRGNFSCPGTEEEAACDLLAQFFSSSTEQCDAVQNYYLTCRSQRLDADNGWIDLANCAEFETSTTSPDVGIQCDAINVFGQPHPYTKSRGNVVSQMLYSLATKAVLWDGLWCDVDYSNIEQNIPLLNFCSYERGGLFTSLTVQELLFAGYTDPSVLKYLDLRFSLRYNLSFECVDQPYDVCHVKQYDCSPAREGGGGVRVYLYPSRAMAQARPNVTRSLDAIHAQARGSFLVQYNATELDSYFAPAWTLSDTQTLLWPHAADPTLAALTQALLSAIARGGNNSNTYEAVVGSVAGGEAVMSRAEYNSTWQAIAQVYEVRNFLWAAFPAWYNHRALLSPDTETETETETESESESESESGTESEQTITTTREEHIAFLKYFQCQNRILFGPVDQFQSCETELFTGRADPTSILQLKRYFGNTTLFPFLHTPHTLTFNGTSAANPNGTLVATPVTGSLTGHVFRSYGYEGFQAFPYLYRNREEGLSYPDMTTPEYFNRIFPLKLKMSQKDLIFQFQRDVSVDVPLPTGTVPREVQSSFVVQARRFTETDATWEDFRSAARPLDAYGMPYLVPRAMASLQSLAGFPLFIETPNSYGNMQWGGIEYTHIRGTVQNEYEQRTFADIDVVTGQAVRGAIRQQVSVRVEANALLQNVFTSQQRCTPPTKAFAKASGYGCFTYLPLLWMEEARVLPSHTLYRYYDHYYTRPTRAAGLTTAGIVLGMLLACLGLCLCVNEAYHRSRFKARVYVD